MQLSTKGGNQSWNKNLKYITRTECDVVFVRTKDGDHYEIPVEVVENKSTITLTSSFDQYKIVL